MLINMGICFQHYLRHDLESIPLSIIFAFLKSSIRSDNQEFIVEDPLFVPIRGTYFPQNAIVSRWSLILMQQNSDLYNTHYP